MSHCSRQYLKKLISITEPVTLALIKENKKNICARKGTEKSQLQANIRKEIHSYLIARLKKKKN
jgi:hypothetical protein